MKGPLFGLVAFIVVIFVMWQSTKLAHLEATGIRAEGQVVRVKEVQRGYGNSSNVYTGLTGSDGRNVSFGHTDLRPIVRFRTHDNETVEFEDKLFSIFPYPGEKVVVLYQPNDPRGKAIIDRGLPWNWISLAVSFVY
jgi:uncharacterized protein DUF3592